MFFLLYRQTNDSVFDDFRRFLTTFRRFPKILENLSEGHTIIAEHFSKISEDYRRFPKISKDYRRLPWTFEEDPKTFQWYINEFNYNYLRDKLDIRKSSISSLVRMWKIHHSSPGCGFVWILQVVYFPVKH